jgi:hypothetical protein
MTDKEEKFKLAVAEYLDLDPEQIHGFVLGVENTKNDALIFSAAWSAAAYWTVLGYINELEVNLKQVRARQSFEEVFTEEGAET